MKKSFKSVLTLLSLLFSALPIFASEANLVVPDIKSDELSYKLLLIGIGICALGAVFGLIEFFKIKKIKVHP